jgi:hypothetical protein
LPASQIAVNRLLADLTSWSKEIIATAPYSQKFSLLMSL